MTDRSPAEKMEPQAMPPRTMPTPTTGRLAPSPTGGLHLGHARTFLLAWLSSRAGGGRVVFRLEDLDASRARPEAARAAVDDLRWLGLDWDEGPDIGGHDSPYVQSQRMDRYRTSLDLLRAQDAIYPCTCTRTDIARAQSAPHPEDEGPIYPGTCSGRSARDASALADRPFAWRFRVPPGPVSWRDRFRGEMSLEPARLGGDFVVARSGIGPSYQLAVVHDDAAMGVTEVIRGDDLLPSTPRQLLLYRSLGLAPPAFAHVPLAIGVDGRRLAKRDGSLKLSTLRATGWDPEILVGWLAQACGWSDRVEPGPPLSWVDRFDLERVPRRPWVVDPGLFMPPHP